MTIFVHRKENQNSCTRVHFNIRLCFIKLTVLVGRSDIANQYFWLVRTGSSTAPLLSWKNVIAVVVIRAPGDQKYAVSFGAIKLSCSSLSAARHS